VRTAEYWLARLVLASVAVCPPLARVYVKILDLAIPRYRRIAAANLKIARIPDEGIVNVQGVIEGMYRSIARMLVTFAKLPHITRENVGDWIRYDGLDNFDSARERGRGVLIPTAHFGNWELSAFAHALMTAPMHIVVRPLDNPKLDELVEHRRALSGNRIIGKRAAAREILRALNAGEAVGILIDQNTAPEEGVFIDFFGVKACANAAFVKFAHHSGAPVVPGFALWSPAERRYVLRFYPEIPMTGEIQADTQRIHSHLENVIRQHPDQYLWIHRRWKTRPPGEPAIY
jgi:KDO2-lipid IV(A) lauroyltransferase